MLKTVIENDSLQFREEFAQFLYTVHPVAVHRYPYLREALCQLQGLITCFVYPVSCLDNPETAAAS
jgi:hypothetical protein